MLSRIGVAIVGIPLLVWILYYGGIPLLILVDAIILVGAYEFFRMAEMGGRKPHKLLGMAIAFLIPNMVYLKEINVLNAGMDLAIVLGLLVLITTRVFQNKIENASVEIGETLIGAMYPAVLFSHCIMISFLPNGGKWLLAVQIMVWVCDSFAYFTGIALGRKIFNRGFNSISPKKSIEGALGGIFFTIIALKLMDKYLVLTENGMNIFVLIIFGVFISIVAQIGDLGESMFKREFKVKDSGTMLKGHGGILDRFDSLLFVAPVIYYLLKFIEI